MIISNVFGGLGNQMFQYAAGRALSLKLQQPMCLDYGDWGASKHAMHNGLEIDQVFNLAAFTATRSDVASVIGLQSNFYLRRLLKKRWMAPVRSRRLVVEPHFHFWPGLLELRESSYLIGFWQSEHYFKEAAAEIRDDFTFKAAVSPDNEGWLSKIKSARSVGLHIRRGDYISNPAANRFHGICSPAHYHRGLEYITQKLGTVELFVFSDDLNWVRQNIRFDCNTHYVDANTGKNSHLDMYLMSECAHNIIANSSFSWWAGWLNRNPNKIVIAPSPWFADASVNTADLYADCFITL